ncbi:hypothetical protein PR202_ga16136 [Eleusine coracana subsp. coracana]|uniref:F-box domain-containing protein n=1 Tax=Eleusine coracana subsp. coracana TaxID=191504 RepID=A0AAV5CKX9_ELECO|nr:hypothetical protein PR202_ga16136 [Eleusine coracana subsp. coracana]
MDLQSMPVDIQEHILLQLDSPICLLRASSTCKLWRRLIAGTVFLQRFRSLHRPPVVGYYHNTNHLLRPVPIFKPAPPVTTTIASRYEQFDLFLPLEWLWTGTVRDSRGSLLLLEIANMEDNTRCQSLYVVDPLTQQFDKIAVVKTDTSLKLEAFLLDGAKPGEIGTSNFRVVYLSQSGTMAAIIKPGGSYRRVRTGNDQGKNMLFLGSAAGSLYWYTHGRTVFSMDKSTAEFSSSTLPYFEDFVEPTTTTKFSVTTGRDGEARIVFLAGDKLNIFARPKGRSGDWVLEKSIPRPSAVKLGVSSAQRFSLGLSMPPSADTKMGMVKLIASSGQMKILAAFNLNIEKKHLKRTEYEKAYPIRLPWPPSLHACSTGGEI